MYTSEPHLIVIKNMVVRFYFLSIVLDLSTNNGEGGEKVFVAKVEHLDA
jgi:hypothetical protein